jgi:hypothetical protein
MLSTVIVVTFANVYHQFIFFDQTGHFNEFLL